MHCEYTLGSHISMFILFIRDSEMFKQGGTWFYIVIYVVHLVEG